MTLSSTASSISSMSSSSKSSANFSANSSEKSFFSFTSSAIVAVSNPQNGISTISDCHVTSFNVSNEYPCFLIIHFNALCIFCEVSYPIENASSFFKNRPKYVYPFSSLDEISFVPSPSFLIFFE